jgi:purine-binding chemotaxis protein CheW
MNYEEPGNNAEEREFIAFKLSDQDYCIDISSVREIRGWLKSTPLPHSPDYIKGLINLRGAVIPIIDFAVRLGMPAQEPTPRHVVIIVMLRDQLCGILVDAVSDILTVSQDSLQPTPDVGSSTARGMVTSVISMEDRMFRVIDLESVTPAVKEIAA